MDDVNNLLTQVKQQRKEFTKLVFFLYTLVKSICLLCEYRKDGSNEMKGKIDDALSILYKSGFAGAEVLQKNAEQKIAKGKKLRQDDWLMPNLILRNMDMEQIWQQLELWNQKALPMSIEMSSYSLAGVGSDGEESKSDGDSNDGSFDDDDDYPMADEDEDRGMALEVASTSSESDNEMGNTRQKKVKFADDNEDDSEGESEGEEEDEDEEDYDDVVDRDIPDKSKQNRRGKDRFFDMEEMEKFADEDIAEEGDELLYADMAADEIAEDNNKAMYEDFFGSNKQQQKPQRKLSEDATTFERQRDNQMKTAEQMEDENVGAKHWTLSGEVEGKQRPENSLLQEHVEFEHATRLAPTVTEDFTKSIEDLIKQRVIDKAWDDVERKVKPVADVNEFRRRAMLDSEKSKTGLAELYEQDYVSKQAPAFGANVQIDEKVENIKKEMKDLFFKLDSLTHFQFTPKEMEPEIRVVKNLPSASFEEAAPTAVSDANLLAPAEIKRPISGELKSKEEQTETDRKRARRRAKAHMRAKQKSTMEKLTARAAKGDTKAEKLLAMEKLKTGARVKVTTVSLFASFTFPLHLYVVQIG